MEKVYDYTEQEAEEYARETAQEVMIRSYEDGRNEKGYRFDMRRKSTEQERDLVERAIGAALLAILKGYDVDAAKATAEYMVLWGSLGKLDPHINSWMSIYVPIGNFLDTKRVNRSVFEKIEEACDEK